MLGNGCLYLAAAIMIDASAIVCIGYNNGTYVMNASLQIALANVHKVFD